MLRVNLCLYSTWSKRLLLFLLGRSGALRTTTKKMAEDVGHYMQNMFSFFRNAKCSLVQDLPFYLKCCTY